MKGISGKVNPHTKRGKRLKSRRQNIPRYGVGVKSFKEIMAVVRRERRRGKKIVTTNGCFDILHLGHIRNLAKAKSLGDILIVGVNSDKSIKSYKGRNRPIVGEKDRAEVLAALQAVDYVFIFNDKTPNRWLAKIRPDAHAKGADRKIGQIVERETVIRGGGRVVLVPYVKDRSTTNVIKKINKFYASFKGPASK